MKFVRARQPEQKEERRRNLMATAREMLEDGMGLEELSLNELARRAGMTKSNVYRYFESREAVLLALLDDEWRVWFEELSAGWPASREDTELDAVIAEIARTIVARPLMSLLTSALPSVLERNLGAEAIRDFKMVSRAKLGLIADFLVTRTARLTRDAALQLLLDLIAIIVGLYPLAHPTEAAERALRTPELCGMKRDYRADLERFLGAIARDLLTRSGAGRRHRG